jgi:hypothetical protein
MIASFLLLPIINIISRRLRWSVQLNITALSPVGGPRQKSNKTETNFSTFKREFLQWKPSPLSGHGPEECQRQWNTSEVTQKEDDGKISKSIDRCVVTSVPTWPGTSVALPSRSARTWPKWQLLVLSAR